MTKTVTAQSALALLLMLSSAGCSWFGRKPKVAATPPQPRPTVSAPVVTVPEPEPQPPAPQVQPEPQQPVPTPPPVQPQPAPQPSKPKPTISTPKPQPPAPAPTPAPPSFGQILSPQQQTELRNSYQQNAQSARQVLNQIKGRALSRDQVEAANRIRSFLSQADEAQAKDPATAAQLAQRAQILARDLQSSLK
ncbi:MAG: hypothetical protein QM757_45935 [Paludibaculum sp.]